MKKKKINSSLLNNNKNGACAQMLTSLTNSAVTGRRVLSYTSAVTGKRVLSSYIGRVGLIET